MIRFGLQVHWTNPKGQQVRFDHRTLALIHAVDQSGSIELVAKALGVSYRTVWGLIADLNAQVGEVIIEKRPGDGTRLSPSGERLKWMLRSAQARLKPRLQSLEEQTRREWSTSGRTQAFLSMALAHEPWFEGWLKHNANQGPLQTSISWHPSLAALSAFHRQEARVAACHLPVQSAHFSEVHQTMRRWLQGPQLLVMPIASRQLGWVSRPSSSPPTLEHVHLRQAKLVNRPSTSAMHHLLSALVTRACYSPADLPGFDRQELSHDALAAAIASGQGDLGLCLQSVSQQFNLQFRPLGPDVYFMVFRESDRMNPAVSMLVRALQHHLGQQSTLAAPSDRFQWGQVLALEDFLISLG